MCCELPAAVARWLQLVEGDEPRACKEQHALCAYVRRVFETEDIWVDLPRLECYLHLARYFPFRQLFPWQEAIAALWLCTFRPDGLPRWKTFFGMLARGGGKDGFIAFCAFCLTSPYNPVPRYNVDICANNEDQATRPVADLVDVLESPGQEAKLSKFYYHTKQLVQGRKNKGTVIGHTNNPAGRDGLRSGCAIFNEVHQYENYKNINVFETGLGKVAEARVGIISSNGAVSDGPLDDYLTKGRAILFEGEDDGGFLPFICCLASKEQVHDEANWYMANPSLAYLPHLLEETRGQYRDWKEHPEQHGDFLPKRMGLRAGFLELSVTDYEKVLFTKRPLPDLTGWSCVAGLDYAEISDWASIDLHFRRAEERYDLNHTWVCRQSKTLPRVRAPWQAWAQAGHLTVVDDVSISPALLAAYLQEAGRIYDLKMLALDHYRWTLISEALRAVGFDAADKNRVKLVRPSDIMQVEPVIQECFDRGLFHWGDCPPLRWAVNNTKRVRSSKKLGVDTGNYIYAKIEGKSRKTDPFMALAAAMTVERVLGNGLPLSPPVLGAIRL